MRKAPWEKIRQLYVSVMSSLHGRLMWLSMLPLMLFAVVWMSYSLLQRYSDLSFQRQQRAELLARQMAVAADFAIFAQNALVLQTITSSVAKEPEVRSAGVFNAQFEPLSVTRNQSADLPSDSVLLQQMQEVARTGQAQLQRVADRSWRYIQPVTSIEVHTDDESLLSDEVSPVRGYAVVDISLDSVYSELFKFLGSVLLILVGFLFIAWSIVSRFSAQLDKSVSSVADAARQIGAGSIRVRLGPSGIKVFDQLAEDLNLMAQRLENAQRDLERRVDEATHALRQQKESAERANNAKSKFLAAASHDLRQPMHALSLLVSAAQRETDPAAQALILRRIETGTSALSDLLNSLLDISRLDGGGVRVHAESFSLDGFMRHLQETYQSLAEEKGLELVVRPTQACTHTDPALLERIVGNLLSNAIRYTPNPGTVYVAVRPRGEQWLIQVRDNGPGIAIQDQQTIFQEFVQLSNPQRDRSQGLGLGLAIVQRLGQLLGHPLELWSRPGQGACFGLRVPKVVLDNSTAAANTAKPSDLQQLSGLRVLVVEDDELVRQSLMGLLCMWGAYVEVFEQADSALEHLAVQAQAPQLVITDHRLGGSMNGLALLRAIARQQGRTIPALLITGDTEDELLRGIAEPGVQVLYKPVKPNVLIATITRMLGPLPPATIEQNVTMLDTNSYHRYHFETSHR